MVAHLLGLRLSLLVGALRGDAWHTARVLSAAVLASAAVAAGCVGVLSLSEASADDARAVIVLGGSAVTLAFLFGPLLTRADDAVDPRGFAVFGLSVRALAMALPLVGIVSGPVVAVVALAVCAAIVGTGHGVPLTSAVAGGALAPITCLLSARVGHALNGLLRREERRSRFGVAVIALLAVGVPAAAYAIPVLGLAPARAIAAAAPRIGMSPLGAAWDLTVHAPAESAGLAAMIAALTALVLYGVGAALTVRLARRAVSAPAPRAQRGLGWFAAMPGTPGGAIAARSILYWLRDPRYLVNVVVVPVAAVIAIVPLLVAGIPLELAILVPVPLIALFLGWLPHDDIAYDSTAVWMHVAAGVPGVSDRVGRLAPLLLFGTPVVAGTVLLAARVHGNDTALPALVGVSACLFFAALGLSSIASVAWPYAVTRPGDSPFTQPQRNRSSGVAAQTSVLVGALVVAAPALWFSWGALSGSDEDAMQALWWGCAAGAIVFAGGIAIGAALFRRRGGRLLELAEAA